MRMRCGADGGTATSTSLKAELVKLHFRKFTYIMIQAWCCDHAAWRLGLQAKVFWIEAPETIGPAVAEVLNLAAPYGL